AFLEAHLTAGDCRPVPLLVLVEELRVDSLPFARDDREPPPDVRRYGNEPRRRRELAARTAAHAAARRGGDARALAVEVGVEQAVQRDDALRVGGGFRDEVDDDAGLFAGVDPHDPADPLLVDAAARGGGEVHTDGRPR